MDQEKIKEVLQDKDFVNQLVAMDKPEDVQAALDERGVELTLDEIKQIGETIRKVQSGEISQEQAQKAADGELSEDELEGVSGGIVGILIASGIFCAAAGTTLGILQRW